MILKYRELINIERAFIITSIFDKNWENLNLTDNELQELEIFIMKNPNAGDVIQGTGGLIKLRWNLPNTGKRGGIRVLFVDFVYQEKVILVNCYSKKEKDTVSDKEKNEYKKFIKEIREEI
jgi:hypothetical protein